MEASSIQNKQNFANSPTSCSRQCSKLHSGTAQTMKAGCKVIDQAQPKKMIADTIYCSCGH